MPTSCLPRTYHVPTTYLPRTYLVPTCYLYPPNVLQNRQKNSDMINFVQEKLRRRSLLQGVQEGHEGCLQVSSGSGILQSTQGDLSTLQALSRHTAIYHASGWLLRRACLTAGAWHLQSHIPLHHPDKRPLHLDGS